jgi:hypothetical protein
VDSSAPRTPSAGLSVDSHLVSYLGTVLCISLGRVVWIPVM